MASQESSNASPPVARKKHDFEGWVAAGEGLSDKRRGWREGVIDESKPFFVLAAGAVVGAAIGETESHFIVQWLTEDEALRAGVSEKLEFFLKRKGNRIQQRMGRWRYLLHSALTSSSNHRARVRILYVEPPHTLAEVEERLKTRADRQDNGFTLPEAARTGNRQIIRLMLGLGTEVNRRDEHGLTALHYAAANGHLEIVEALLAKGADVNARSFERVPGLPSVAGRGKSETALHKAKTPEIEDLLIQHGADTKAQALTNLTAAQMDALRDENDENTA